jgi:hypothetical protein
MARERVNIRNQLCCFSAALHSDRSARAKIEVAVSAVFAACPTHSLTGEQAVSVGSRQNLPPAPPAAPIARQANAYTYQPAPKRLFAPLCRADHAKTQP